MVIWASSPVSTFRLVVGLWGPGAQFDALSLLVLSKAPSFTSSVFPYPISHYPFPLFTRVANSATRKPCPSDKALSGFWSILV